jgi:hypothetical protein
MSDDNPTPEAYDAACKALWKHRDSLAELIPLLDAVLDHADAHCRAFPIATAPQDKRFWVWNDTTKDWYEVSGYDELLFIINRSEGLVYTHWRPDPPPPSNPPLPAVFIELGAALERLKSQS